MGVQNSGRSAAPWARVGYVRTPDGARWEVQSAEPMKYL